MPPSTPISSPAPSTTSKPANQAAPVVRPWIPPQAQTDPKLSNRDPRLNRVIPPAAPQPKEQPVGKKADAAMGSPALVPERSTQPDKPKIPRKEVIEDKSKSKSPSPMTKSVQSENKQTEVGTQKSDDPKKDPRLKKRPRDKADTKDEIKEKKRNVEKKEREEDARGGDTQRIAKGKLVNGSVTKHNLEESAEKDDLKSGGNARTHNRKRPYSRSRSRSPGTSPKRKERRSPKSRTRSSSLSPAPSHKAIKPRRLRADEPEHGKPGREERLVSKKNQSEGRRLKRPGEERHSESRDSHSPRSHDGGGKGNKDASHRWRSSWEENKQ